MVKTTTMMMTYHANFSKYVFTWMFAEGVIIISGLGYNGPTTNNSEEGESGAAKWDALTNFKYGKFLFGPFFQDVLEGMCEFYSYIRCAVQPLNRRR